MKHLRKVMTLVIAAIMALAVSMPAFAASDGSITIQNTVNGKEYNVYKVFDATYSGTNVSYTYDGSNETFLAALQGNDSPFTAVKPSGSSVYNIALKDGKSASDVVTFLNAQKANLGNAVATKTGDGKTQVIQGLDYGYYYITTTTGSEVTIDSAIKDVTVIDKNEEITPPDKEESADQGTEKTWSKDTTAFIGDTIYFKVDQEYVRYVGETLVTNLVMTDKMDAGLTPNKDVKVFVGENELASTAYTVTYEGQNFKLTIPTASVNDTTGATTFNYDDGIKFTITYSGILNENAVIDAANKNEITTQYNDNTNFDNNTDSTTVETYDFLLKKVDGQNKYLEGAGFKLYDAETDGNQILLAKDGKGYYTKADGDSALEIMVDSEGGVNVRGLKAGTYWLEETTTPPGYNTLVGRQKVEISAGGTAPVNVTVTNNEGTELPSTGGMGTRILYTVGGIMLVGGAIALVSKKRAASLEK